MIILPFYQTQLTFYYLITLAAYPPMAFYLNKAGRPIVLGCEYALYQQGASVKVKQNKTQIYLILHVI